LAQAGFAAKSSSAANSQVPEGQVATQSPAPGTTVPKGSQVVLVISTGDKIAVPFVIGMTEVDAQRAIQTAGLGTAPPNHDGQDSHVPVNRVESQDPTAGSLQPRGTIVHINIRIR